MHRRSGRRLSAALVALTCLGAPAWAQEARLIGALTLRVDHPQWGGLSGVEMAADGGSLVAVSDRGILFRATVTRDESGQITGLTLLTTDELTGRDGQRGPWAARDSEGLAMRADGTLFISFEGDHRVARYIGGGASEPNQELRVGGERVGVADGRTVTWDDVTVLANGDPITGVALYCSRDDAGVKLVGESVGLGVSDHVRVSIER